MHIKRHLSGIIVLWSAAVLAALVLVTGCENPAGPAGPGGLITWSVMQSGGVDGETTSTHLVFSFSADPGSLAAADITLASQTGAATPGALAGSGRNRTLALAGVGAQGDISVSIDKAGMEAGPKTARVYKQGAYDGITWSAVISGHDEAGLLPSNLIEITFSAPVAALETAWIVFVNYPAEKIIGTPVAVNAEKTVWRVPFIQTRGMPDTLLHALEFIYLNNPAFVQTRQPLQVRRARSNNWTVAETGGVTGVTDSAAIVITFDRPLRAPLTGSNITITGGYAAVTGTGAVVSGDGGAGRVWRLPLTGVAGNGAVSVTLSGVESQTTGSGTKGVTLYSATADTDFTVTQTDGVSGNSNTTALVVTFSRAVTPFPGITVAQAGGNAAVNNSGAAASGENTVWTVPVTGVYVEGAVNVSVGPVAGIIRESRSVTVYRVRSIKIADGTTELEAHLAGLGATSAGSPAAVTLHSSVNLSADWALVNSMVNAAGKYVTLNLSALPAVTVTGEYTGSPTGNSFNIISSNPYIKGIVLPSGLTGIGANALFGCAHLAGTLTIPANVVDIGAYAFSGTGFTALVFSGGGSALRTIDQRAFKDCAALAGTLTIPSGVTTIGISAFEGCSGFTGSLAIPNSVTTLNSSAFKNCSGLTSLTLNTAITVYPTAVFSGCGGFTGTLAIPSGVTTLATTLFANAGFSAVVIPASVTSIPAMTFQTCPNLASVTFLGNNTNVANNNSFPFQAGATTLKAAYEDGKQGADKGVAGTYTRTIDQGAWTAWSRAE
jgi:hypothetical protein